MQVSHRALLGALALSIATTGAAGAVAQASAASAPQHKLVVRGESTVTDGGCAAGVCKLQFTGGTFRGTPVGTGSYAGTVNLAVARITPNGEGGVCAPIGGRITLGGGADRLVLALSGDSCQDGAGALDKSAFTTLATWKVDKGTGAYAKASGHGLATFSEDAADHDRMTLVGKLTV
jgi:hypothetical protein